MPTRRIFRLQRYTLVTFDLAMLNGYGLMVRPTRTPGRLVAALFPGFSQIIPFIYRADISVTT